MTELSVLVLTVHRSNEWLNDLQNEFILAERQDAYRVLRSVLHAWRDKLQTEELAQLSAQLLILFRGILHEGWNPSADGMKTRSKEGLLDEVYDLYGPKSPVNC